MFPYQTEIFTAVTIVLAGAILMGYVSALKKNGWIGKTGFEKDAKTISFQSLPEFAAQNTFASLTQSKISASKLEKKESPTQKTEAPADKPKETKAPRKKKTKKTEEPQKDKPAGCSHYFGYLASLPKMTATPEECYFCSKLIECYKEMKN